MDRKAILVLSSASGHALPEAKVEAICRRLCVAFSRLEVYRLGDLDRDLPLLEKKTESFDVVLVSGGDGTFNHVVDRLSRLQSPPVFGYLNSGTIGDVGRNFGVGKSLSRSLRIIEEGHICQSDLIEINGCRFCYMGAIGAYSDISYSTPRRLKTLAGRLAYYDMAIREAFRKKTVHYRLSFPDGSTLEGEAPFVMVLNGRNVGGFPVNRNCAIDDGLFEVYLSRKGVFNGLLHYLPFNRNKPIKADEIWIQSDYPGPWCIDGEKGPQGDVHIKTLRKTIAVFCSKKHSTGRF